MNDWQPIETAPRDGSEILIFDGARVVLTSFDTDYRTWPDDNWERFSHWMPLPSAPNL